MTSGAPASSINALGTPIPTGGGSEVAWLPETSPTAILERFRAYGGLDSASDEEWWHEERRNACRAYLGTLLNWRAGCTAGTVKVEAADLNCDIHRMLWADIRECFPWDDVLTLYGRLAAMSAGARFGAVAVREELYCCLELGSRWEHLDAVAEAVHFCRRRDERARLIRRMAGVAHSPAEVAELCARLGEVT